MACQQAALHIGGTAWGVINQHREGFALVERLFGGDALRCRSGKVVEPDEREGQSPGKNLHALSFQWFVE
jgi:hypothetical protein